MSSLEGIEKQTDDQNHLETPVLDQAWVDQTTLKTSNQLDFLLSEYKKQKDEGVKSLGIHPTSYGRVIPILPFDW
ncbi:hypothetical protein OESDEN_16286 [Oesophagostomum dentatum]|uniref:Uncharacterized protein n=1 Tax=Oesophagostomum dentatum TaxID=61180 RepID=A0A0B1SGF5_OESDE|nr:hypothetical protein OESDEN_16286 [Oesophagostomum dentatum]